MFVSASLRLLPAAASDPSTGSAILGLIFLLIMIGIPVWLIVKIVQWRKRVARQRLDNLMPKKVGEKPPLPQLTRLLPIANKQTHVYMIGQPGVGKSKLLELFAVEDIWEGYGLALLDPAGDIFHHLVSYFAYWHSYYPEIAERFVIIDPTNPDHTVSFNPLQQVPGIPPQRTAGFVVDVISKVWQMGDTDNAGMKRIMTNAFTVLCELNLTLLDLPDFLRDAEWRERLLTRVKTQEVVKFFTQEFPRTPAGASQWITPIMTRMAKLTTDPDIAPLFAGGQSLNFRRIMDEGKVVLVNLAKGEMGEDASYLLGALIVAQIKQAAMSRKANENRKLFPLYLDEFQNYTTDDIVTGLTELRKFGLSFHLAHQFLAQLPNEIRLAVLNTAGNIFCFRVGREDASRLAKELWPTAGAASQSQLKVNWGGVMAMAVGGLGQPLRRDTYVSSWEDFADVLTNLKNRTFVSRWRREEQPRFDETPSFPDPVHDPAAEERFLTATFSQNGRRKAEVWASLQQDRQTESPQRLPERNPRADILPAFDIAEDESEQAV